MALDRNCLLSLWVSNFPNPSRRWGHRWAFAPSMTRTKPISCSRPGVCEEQVPTTDSSPGGLAANQARVAACQRPHPRIRPHPRGFQGLHLAFLRHVCDDIAVRARAHLFLTRGYRTCDPKLTTRMNNEVDLLSICCVTVSKAHGGQVYLVFYPGLA